MKKFILLFTLLIMSVGVSISQAAPTSWSVDKVHSGFYFKVDHIYSKVFGFFKEFDGDIRFDPENLDESSFVFEIQVDSVFTNNSKRDKHLRSADFFDSSSHPIMRFVSQSIVKTGDNSYDVAGVFTVKGKDHNLTLPLILAGIKDHPMVKNGKVSGFNGEVSIDRLEHGVGTGKFYKLGVVGKQVDIFVTLELISK